MDQKCQKCNDDVFVIVKVCSVEMHQPPSPCMTAKSVQQIPLATDRAWGMVTCLMFHLLVGFFGLLCLLL